MRTTILVACLGALLGVPLTAAAQSAATYRAQVTAEAGGIRINEASPLIPAGARGWTDGSLFVATGAGSWEPGSRLRLAGGLALTGLRGGEVRLRVREAYSRVSVTNWMDVEAGKRLVRWGVGYGFAPAGVLDPPRLATDPTDRLGINEGRPLGRVDLFRGETSLTVAAAGALRMAAVAAAGGSRVTAARLRTVLSGGVEVAVIASAAPDAGPSWGGTITHVIGQQLEWHAEVIEQDALGSRSVSAVAGAQRAVSGMVGAQRAVSGVVGAQRAVSGVVGAQRAVSGVVGAQYTFLNGVNVVVEYHRNGRALEGHPSTGLRAGRQSLFMRAVRSTAEAGLAPEVILIAGLDDGSRTVVPGITWTPTGRVQLHARATRLFGGRRSIARLAPWSTSLNLGATLRF
jgi:hypothetical protein